MSVLFRCLWWPREAGEGHGLTDVFLDPVREFGVLRPPAGESVRNVALGLGELGAIIEPAQLLQALVVSLPQQIIHGISQEVHIAALLGALRSGPR